MNQKEIKRMTDKYNDPPPDGYLCERCGVNECGENMYGKKQSVRDIGILCDLKAESSAKVSCRPSGLQDTSLTITKIPHSHDVDM